MGWKWFRSVHWSWKDRSSKLVITLRDSRECCSCSKCSYCQQCLKIEPIFLPALQWVSISRHCGHWTKHQLVETWCRLIFFRSNTFESVRLSCSVFPEKENYNISAKSLKWIKVKFVFTLALLFLLLKTRKVCQFFYSYDCVCQIFYSCNIVHFSTSIKIYPWLKMLHFQSLKSQLLINKFLYAVQKHRSTDLKDLKLGNIPSGSELSLKDRWSFFSIGLEMKWKEKKRKCVPRIYLISHLKRFQSRLGPRHTLNYN